MPGVTFTPPPVPSSTAPLRSAVRYGVIALIVLAVVSAVVAYLVAGTPGLWGALIGSAVGGVFILATAASVLWSANLPPTTVGAVLLGGWLAKMLVAIVVLGILRGMDFYSRPALGLVLLASLLIVLGAETVGVLRQRAPYVDTPPSDGK
ncbi:hypothetical protein HQ606_06095 [Rhodococcus kroppenstedtii]|uniref:ATP synthase protein I n=1 Tax=Rhodococcoides kroppenstedtii TaxID=293050 RepID=A0ABS7NQ52_9NOCA|nr:MULTISPECIES: hypothetical protein [Rhodococcus]MBY6313810.1 hypothetical protein [Rhodococcus kroppenstedtii]MBY6320126.1 hypothetical protein [Rhodococcus kroppenstedtii]MBY6399065.1 hypothetical protein [Rhodococcus kroppenstedtii]MBY6435550.1 hypothetical protein [Rhodococcus kroppenstedtii]